MSQKLREKRRVTKRSKDTTSADTAAVPTLMDHLKELQGRLFSTVLVFLLTSSAAYPFFGVVTEFLMAPLKQGQELVYLTPGGAFSFILKVCIYIGLVGTLPVIIFHAYRFFMPAVRQVMLRTVLGYTLASFALAVTGLLFAYYVSLPAALQFLTGFDLNHINPMLTIDSYFSFIMTYMLAGALLFQLPLIMLIINSAKPLTPSKLMKAQGKIILGSFIVAAVISPTPDAVNQTILASPMVVMYQLGIIMIAIKNRKRKRPVEARVVVSQQHSAAVLAPLPRPVAPVLTTARLAPRPIRKTPSKVMDIAASRVSRPLPRVAVPARSEPPRLVLPARPEPSAVMSNLTMQSLDGVMRVGRVA